MEKYGNEDLWQRYYFWEMLIGILWRVISVILVLYILWALDIDPFFSLVNGREEFFEYAIAAAIIAFSFCCYHEFESSLEIRRRNKPD